VRPTTGSVRVCGAPAGSPTARRALGYLAELFRFPGWASADELLHLHQRLAGSEGGAAERAELLELVGLSEAAGRRVETMSKGMQQRLGIAQALIGGPRLLLLDEPTSALDPAGRRVVRDLLEELRRRGVSVLLNTHLLSEVERVCDRVAIIDRGELLAAGRPDELARPSGVEVETADGTRRFDGATRDDVPAIVERLVADGERIYEVRLVRSTLEDAYLAVVEHT
jgi:ABC-2 type transport system ATP-binding protein